MKNLAIIFSLIFCLVIAEDSYAQLSKQERKEWKKRIKDLEPEQYKNLLDENKILKEENTEMEDRLDKVDVQLADKDDQIEKYKQQINALQKEVASMEEKVKNASADGSVVNDQQGVVFKVQIGAFTKKEDLAKYKANSTTFNAEKDNNIQKFTLGAFKDYWEADTFKKYLRSMGVKDAWIVAFNDGQRVPLKDVLEGII